MTTNRPTIPFIKLGLSFALLLVIALGSFAQTFNGSAINTAGNSLIPSTGTGGCTVLPQTTGGTIFNNTVAGLLPGTPLVSALVNFTHTFDSDIDMYLRAPNGQILELSTDNGGGGDNYTNTVFNDAAAINITAGTPPFTGTFRPEGTLTASACGTTITPTVTTLGGFTPSQNGVWQLVIKDDVGADVGAMINWSLTFVPTLAPCTLPPALNFTQSTPTAIPTGPGVVTSTLVVSGAPTYLYDLNLTTFITHSFAADLDITLQSPAGTVVTLTTDNGAGNDNVFNGTLWDDDANPAGQVPYTTNNGVTTDHAYVNLTTATPLTPEEPLGAFIGENPNGTWTITISDDLAGDGGSLNSWTLAIRALPSPPVTALTSATNSTPVPIVDVGVVTSTLNVAGAGTQLLDLNLTTFITHTFAADLDITLMSPAGTIVTLTTDNGSGNDNVFNGTLWDDDANPAGQVPYTTNNGVTTDHAYVDLTTATPLAPEEPLAAFIGENPNGTWTITISDDLGGDVGSLNSWTLDIITSLCPIPCTLTCPANITVSNTPGQCGAVVNYPAPTTSGPCGTITATPASGSFFPIGTTTVTVTTTAGPSCTFTITVNDTQAPTIVCPSNITVPNNTGLCGAVVNYQTPVAIDNCTPAATPVQIPASFTNHGSGGVFTLSGNNAPGGMFFTITNTSTETRGVFGFGIRFGNPAFGVVPAPQTLTVWSRPGGLSTAIENSTAGWTNQGPQVVNPILPYFATGTGPLSFCGLNTPIVMTPGSIYSFFIHGATACPVFNGTVGVITPPVSNGGFTLAGGTVSYGVLGSANHFQQGVTNVIINTNIQYKLGAPATQTTGLPSGSFFPVGTTLNTFTATDASGNTATCSFNVTVNDTEQPVFTLCPANVVRSTDPGACVATYTPPQPTFTDNCGVTRLTYSITQPPGFPVINSPATGINYVPSTPFQLNGTTGTGVSTIVYTATDAAGNTRTCTFTVTVNDASIPVITTQPPLSKFVCVGSDGTFTVIASAGAGNPLAYQWQIWNGSAWVNVSGASATTATLVVPSVSFTQNTNTYRCVLTGRCSVVISGTSTLYVNPLPSVTVVTSIPPALVPGQSLNISSTVSPGGGTYRWYKNGVLLTSPLQQLPVLSGLTVNDIGTYYLVYTDLNGCQNRSADVVISGQSSDNLWVYPVPNNGTFQVRFFNNLNEQATVRVWDAKGSKVYERAMVTTLAYTSIVVDLGDAIADGVYIVELVNGAGKRVGVKKIVVRQKP